MVLNITRGITMRAAYPKVLAKAEAA
jgi:hypothetical protein